MAGIGKSANADHKFKSLDGLRGIAALIVVLCHYCNAFLPSFHGRESAYQTSLDKLVAMTPLHLLIGGEFAVSIFFVLSGFVLTLKFFKTRSVDVVVASASRRYFRLMLPVLASIIVCYVLLQAGMMQLHYMDRAPLPSDWAFAPHLINAVWQGTYSVFFSSVATYNPVLWTMHVELFGSFILFMFMVLFGKLDKRWIVYLVFGLIFIKTNYLAFIVGMALSDIWVNRSTILNVITPRYAHVLLALGILLGGWYISPRFPGVYSFIKTPFFNPEEAATLAHTFGGLCIIVAILRLGWLTKLLQMRISQYLGKVSFSLYLVHFIVLGSLGSYLFNHLINGIGFIGTLVITCTVSIGFTFIVADWFTNNVDSRSVAAARSIGQWLLSKGPIRTPDKGLNSETESPPLQPLLQASRD